jgi:hypothetical protein
VYVALVHFLESAKNLQTAKLLDKQQQNEATAKQQQIQQLN